MRYAAGGKYASRRRISVAVAASGQFYAFDGRIILNRASDRVCLNAHAWAARHFAAASYNQRQTRDSFRAAAMLS
jgi:hypothetical protein